MAITATGTFNSTSGTALATQSVTSANAGDLAVLAVLVTSTAASITSIANGTADGGGWSRKLTYLGLTSTTLEVWTARVGTPGTVNADITWSSVGGAFVDIGRRCYTAGLGASTVWALDGTASGQDNGATTTCAFPSKTAAGSGELYLGFGFGNNFPLVAGATSGVVYNVTSADNMFLHHVSVSGSLAPVTGTHSSQTSASLGMLLTASASGTTAPAGAAAGAGAALQPTVTKTLTPTLIRQPYTARRRASTY